MAAENVNLKISYVVIYVHECMYVWHVYIIIKSAENTKRIRLHSNTLSLAICCLYRYLKYPCKHQQKNINQLIFQGKNIPLEKGF